ncbi:MAG: hypothetical protein FWC70_11540, partial [Defluviitaleaceae bacterium]|nr:hypothetical protein [Defluviitaleaceae bacterium]
ANALEKSVQVSSENAQKPAISRLAFTVLKGVRYTCAKALVLWGRQIESGLSRKRERPLST